MPDGILTKNKLFENFYRLINTCQPFVLTDGGLNSVFSVQLSYEVASLSF